MNKGILLVFLTIFYAKVAFAHEYWLEPKKFWGQIGEEIPIQLYVGDSLVKELEERVFQKDKTPVFRLFSAGEVFDLKAFIADGAKPVYVLKPKRDGGYLFFMHRNWSYITLPADKFELYLKEDGMEYIIEERKKRGEQEKPARERYCRFIKTLVQIGDTKDKTYKSQTGAILDIIPMENPYLKRLGDTLRFQVLFEGKPLSNKSVFAIHKELGRRRYLTNQDGIFQMKLEKPGLWLVHLVLMRRCNCNDADWESFWGAFSFGVK